LARGGGDLADDLVGGAWGEPATSAVEEHRAGVVGAWPGTPHGEPGVERGGQCVTHRSGPLNTVGNE
jgi:hypothetical protein